MVWVPHIGGDPIGKSGGHRGYLIPILSLVPGNIEAPIGCKHEMVRVLGIDPNRMNIDMPRLTVPAGSTECRERFAAIQRSRGGRPGNVDCICVLRVYTDLAEIQWPLIAVTRERPGNTVVIRAVQPATFWIQRWRRLLIGSWRRATPARPGGHTVIAPVECPAPTGSRRFLADSCDGVFRSHLTYFDLRVHHAWVGASYVDGNPAVGSLCKAVTAQSIPALSTVGRLPKAASGPTSVVATSAATPLITCGVERIAIRRVHDDVCESCIVIDEFDPVPRAAAVHGFVNTAIWIRSEEVSIRGNVYDVRVLWIDDDARYCLRPFETDVGPRLAAVRRLVNAVAKRGGISVIGFARSSINDVGICRTDG